MPHTLKGPGYTKSKSVKGQKAELAMLEADLKAQGKSLGLTPGKPSQSQKSLNAIPLSKNTPNRRSK